jgi:hypothetical protein
MDSKPPNGDPASAYLADALTIGSECLEAAVRYRNEFNLSSLALCHSHHLGAGRQHSKTCRSPGKRPWYRWAEFQTRLPGERELRDLWREKPVSNVGFATGEVSGVIRIDVEGDKGEARLAEMARGEPLPPTWEFVSGRAEGGRGLLYSIPPGITLRTTSEQQDTKQEIRFQGRGAQSVLPPSLHVSGRRYEWVPGHAPWEIVCAAMPAWLIENMRADAPRPNGRRRPRPLGEVGGEGHGEVDGPLFAGVGAAPPIKEGARHNRLLRLGGRLRFEGVGADDIAATLLAVNRALCSPPLAEDEVTFLAHDIVARYSPGPSPARKER